MKTLVKKGLCLLLVLGAQIFAQRFTAAEPDVVITGSLGNGQSYGYFPQNKQTAALGEKNSAYANLLLLAGGDTILSSGSNNNVGTYKIVDSYNNIQGNVYPLASSHSFKNTLGETVYDNVLGAVTVLDSLSDSKKNAKVLFATAKRLIVMEIAISNANNISGTILKTIDMPESIWQTESQNAFGYSKRLALLNTSQSGTDKTYHFAIGSPYSQRVDFFSLSGDSWTFFQPNSKGLASGVNGLFFEDNSLFGIDLISIGDLDSNGYNDLAVLMPKSNQHPQSAIYIFFMDNEWTQSSRLPVIIAGNTVPWQENPEKSQDCRGISSANWNNEGLHLLVSCNEAPAVFSNYPIAKSVFVKDITLNSNGNILNSSVLYKRTENISSTLTSYGINTNPLAIKNHKNNLPAVSLFINGPVGYGNISRNITFSVMDADFSKNFLLEAGKAEAIVNLDSLFYRSGTSGFSVSTLYGLVECGIQYDNLLCEAKENAIGTWSSLEISSKSECNSYRECKRKDTIFVYAHSKNENRNTALRIPKSMVLPFFGQINFSNLKSLAYFKNPDLKNTDIRWNSSELKLSAATSNNPNSLSIIPFSQREGIDTIIFSLSISGITDSYLVGIHATDTSKILNGAIPETPGSDTVWNTARKKYIALPHKSPGGSIYTYDIAQSGLGAYAEIIGDYLHVLKVDVAEISIAYTENSQIKHRTITLMPEPKPEPEPELPTPIATFANGGMQIDGLNDEVELKAYNFKGMVIQSERAVSQGSVFIKLKHNIPQIVQIKSASGEIKYFVYYRHGHR
jgi:hypothetical protein